MLNFKMDKVKSRLLLMRWAVLGCLMLAVGAVAIWGGSPRARLEQSAGIDNILTTHQTRLAQLETNPDQNRLTQQLQAHIGEDAQPVLPANADLQPSLPTTQTEKLTDNTQTPTVQNTANAENQPDTDTADTNTEANSSEADEEVIDNAPEPWVGDELLTVEANLQQMLPPISGLRQDSSGILRGFGYGHDDVFGDYRFHSGVDLAGSLGAAVLAPLAGTIREIREDSFMGASIVLEHEGKLQTRYFGLKPQTGLQTGQQVIAGEKLGEICAPPPFEEGMPPHLHWEIRLDGEAIDAAAYGFDS
ncbi:MAG: M23 family metallopeptidase [Firmicutes bacterium]|nr:M23 family metallopeptidase [Bacillota bacterium]